MPCVHKDWITKVSFFIQFLYILASCHGIKVHQGNSHSSPKRQEHIAATLPAAYEIVEPVKVDEKGAFISYTLYHNVESKRRKRDLNSQRVHYRIIYKTEELLFNMTIHDGFLSDNYILERRAGKLSSVKMTPRSGRNCHLVGTVQQQDTGGGFAAISACQGLAGFFRLSHGDYFIEPFHNSSQPAGRRQKHIIYKRESQNPHRNRRDLPVSKYQSCGVSDDQSSALKQERRREKWERKYQTGRKITQRSVSKERWVETLVVADTKMIQYHGSENVESYIFTIMNMVTGLFHDASIGNAIHIKVVRLILLEEEEEGLKIVHHADQTLASFCKWQKSINPKSDTHPAHHDIAVLLTRKDICVGRNSPCETLGLSYLSGMCQPHRSCNINEDSGLPVAFTIAHEIGHSFGIHHDGQGNDCELSGQPFIMSRQLKYDTSPLTWSTCSKEDITRFLDRGWGFCLDDVPVKKDVKPPFVAPGVLYDLNHQCQLQYGPNATVCDLVDNVCQTLWCLVHDSCRSKLDAAVDGTRCGENKWCFNGKCILVGRHPESIHGGWGTWSAWSHCTRTCGAGVQSAERKCSNPEPKYGGKYCTGERKRYRLCKTSPCPNTGPSFRQMQCSEFDTVPYKNELYQWVPIYNTENPCALHCRPTDANFADKLLDAVIDGTPCFDGNNSKDVCINGMCKRVGCDHEINSNATEDRCGVCLGDDSTCQTIKYEFNQSEGFGYVDVGKIPKGARDIKIEEVKAAGNFLSLRSEDPEKYYLNGGFTIQWNGDYKVAGTTFHYERNGDLENLTASGPTNESVWIQLLFQESNPGIKYEYVIQKDLENETESTYSWEYGWWTDCSMTCGTGVQRQVAQCVNKQRGVVINTFCDQDLQPDSRQRKCHIQDCPPRWWVGEWQPCSTTCGPTGDKKRTVLCVRTVGSDEQALPSEDCHHLTKPKGYMSCNRDILCPSDWTVSNWSECSVTCGGGVRTRNITCSKNNDEPCEVSKKPNAKALCGLQQCPLEKNLPPVPIKNKYGKKIIKIIPKKPGIPTKRIIFRKIIRKYHSTTKTPKLSTTSAPKMILSPAVNSIKDDFQINDIPNSTHFNVDYKYNFVLVENNKRKVNLNSTKLVPTVSTGGENYGEANVENKTENNFYTGFTTTEMPENITSTYDFLTEEPETQTASEEINVSDDETNGYDDTENSIIESRSKRHKGRSNMIQYNQSTIMYHSESPTPNSNLITTESPKTFNIQVYISLVETEQNATLSEKNLDNPAVNTSEELDNLHVTIVNVSEDLSKKSNNTTIGGLPHINITDLVFNVSEKVYWIIGNWSECSTTCGLGAEWRSVECSTSTEADCKHIKKPDPARKCHLRPCASWRSGNWSKCSTNCGGGFRTREVQCIDTRENRPLRPFHCQSHGPNPQQNSSCNPEPCLSWLAKPWSECSKTCGSGIRQRQVICPIENRCDLKKSPVITINCSEKPCVRWKTDAWSECSVSCGEGIQKRTVECMNIDNNSTMNHTLCEDTVPKPQDTQMCANQDCKKNIDPLCKKDKMSMNFCKTVKSIGKCSMKNIEKECCFTCMQPETRLQGG